jgi:hypothetical protein
VNNHGVSDDQWAEFVQNHRATSGLLGPDDPEAPKPGKAKRRWGAKGPLVVAGVVVAAAGFAVYGLLTPHPHHAVVAAAPSAAPATAAPSSASGTAPSTAPTGAAPLSASVGAAPLSVFAPQVAGGYTLVLDKTLDSCTGSDEVAPPLAGMITQSRGCEGLDVALYRDQAGNQYNLALFTMKDPADLAHLITQLSSDPTDFEVAVQAPPSGSGLRTLPADSGMVQSFDGYRQNMLIGMGQWSDGHVGDFNTLEKQLGSLAEATMDRLGVPAHPQASA